MPNAKALISMKIQTQSIEPEYNKHIIQALKANDEKMFDAIYRHYFKRLCAFCSQYVDFDESEEIVQETMIWLWENRSSLIPELMLHTLLFTIVKNKALNRITHFEVRRKVHQEIVDKYQEEFSSPDFYLQNELFALYKRAIEKLPQEFRQAYELNRNAHLTHKEIAEKLNVSPQTVNYRIGQALKQLRLALKDYMPLLILFGYWPK